MTTWYGHYPLSHPWMPSRKRKLSTPSELDSSSASDIDTQERLHCPSLKRRRYDLAGNLSQLSLFEQASREAVQSHHSYVTQGTGQLSAARSDDSNTPTWSIGLPPDAPMDADSNGVIIDHVRPIVEEPGDVPNSTPDVRMHNTSSYEPEKDRIVITDLDSSEDEADTPPQTPNAGGAQYSVSPAFLSRLKGAKFAVPLMRTPSSTGDSDPSRALVLFTPSPWAAKDPHELDGMYRARDWEQDSRELVVEEVESADADAMEVE